MFSVVEAISPQQKNDLFKLRYEIFVTEQHKYRETADHGARVLRDPLDDVAEHLCLVHSGKVVGSLSRRIQRLS